MLIACQQVMTKTYQGRNYIMKILLLIAVIPSAQSVFTHCAGLDSNGGHNDRKKNLIRMRNMRNMLLGF
jgi:hypothetical protein